MWSSLPSSNAESTPFEIVPEINIEVFKFRELDVKLTACLMVH